MPAMPEVLTVQERLDRAIRHTLESIDIQYLIDELCRRGKNVLEITCPHCERQVEIPPEIFAVEVEVKK